MTTATRVSDSASVSSQQWSGGAIDGVNYSVRNDSTLGLIMTYTSGNQPYIVRSGEYVVVDATNSVVVVSSARYATEYS